MQIRITSIPVVAAFCLPLFGAACSVDAPTAEATQAVNNSMHGRAGAMPAFYDDQEVTVNMKEMPNSDPLIEHNKSINNIYAYADLDEEQLFPPILDAIQGDGFNPLWLQNLIVFPPNVTPIQFTSDTEVLAAAAAGTITIEVTDEVYRCAVIAPK